MSSKRIRVYPPNPSTTRGGATKLGSSGDKIIYPNGKSIIIRDLTNPANDVVYSGHVHGTCVGRVSPSGYYAASADVQGNVRVWDVVGAEQILKAEYKVLGGKINDLSWDGESKRIIAVGDAREKFGHVFQVDTGSSAGEIAGHSKAINTVAVRHQRPFRAATAGDDGLVVFHTGAPYKYDKTLKAHTNFVHSLAYASSGTHFISTGSDAKVFLWDGGSGERVAEFGEGGAAHKGSIYAGSWAPDCKSVVTSSADCTVKLWDVETRKAATQWTLGTGTGVDHQQVGNTWTSGGSIVSLSMEGVVNVFDPRRGGDPVKVLHGAQKSITSTSTSIKSSTFLAGSADGRIHALALDDDEAGELARVEGAAGHTNLVSGIAGAWSVGFDDRVREMTGGGSGANGLAFSGTVFGPTASQPKSIAVSEDGQVFVAEAGHVEVVRAGQRVGVVEAGYGAVSVAVSADGVAAVGGEDTKIHLYTYTPTGTLTETGVLAGTNKGAVSAVAFSPDGELLAAGDTTGKIVVYDVKTRTAKISRWTNHSSRIYSLAWTSDGAHLASGSLDTHVYIWSVAKVMKNIAIKNAVPGGVWGVQWVPGDDAHGAGGKLVAAGADGAVRIWSVAFHL